MNDTALIIGFWGVLAVGYLLGRHRPLYRARDWAWWEINGYGRFHCSRLRMTIALTLRPEMLAWAWVNRKKAPKTRFAKAPQLNEIWPDKLKNED
jgi:hypothetical protein